MVEILKTLRDTPLPSILVIGGLVFLLLPFLKKTGGAIEIETSNKGIAAFIGVILLVSGIGLYLLPTSPANPNASTTIPVPTTSSAFHPTEIQPAPVSTATVQPVVTQASVYPIVTNPTQVPTLVQPVQSNTALVNHLFLGSNVSISSLVRDIQSPSQVSQEQLEGVVRTIQAEADRLHSARAEGNSVTLSADNWWLAWCSNVPAQYTQIPAGWSYLFEQKLPTFGQLYVIGPTAQIRRLESCNSPWGWWAVVVYFKP